MIEEHENIELRSGEVQEILGTPPNWIIRWGTVIIFLILAILTGIGYMVKYPDVIRAPMKITTNIPPVKVVARTSGYIDQLLVNDNESVKKDSLIAVMKTTANFEDIFKITADVDQLLDEGLTIAKVVRYKPSQQVKLGEAQTAYDDFFQEHQNLKFNRQQRFDKTKESDIQNRIAKVKQSITKLESRKKIADMSLSVAENNYNVQRTLYSKKATTIGELQAAKQETLKAEQAIEAIKLDIDEKENDILQLESQITQVKQENSFSKTDKLTNVKVALTRLRSQLLLWKEKNLLYANADGQVTFFGEVGNASQFVKVGDEVLTIIPDVQSKILGQVSIPVTGSGKVKVGQQAVIKLDGYPFAEYGTITGRVAERSALPKDSKYVLKIDFPDGLKTSHGNIIDFQQEMEGTAEIITENRRFLERIFDRLLTMIKNR